MGDRSIAGTPHYYDKRRALQHPTKQGFEARVGLCTVLARGKMPTPKAEHHRCPAQPSGAIFNVFHKCFSKDHRYTLQNHHYGRQFG